MSGKSVRVLHVGDLSAIADNSEFIRSNYGMRVRRTNRLIQASGMDTAHRSWNALRSVNQPNLFSVWQERPDRNGPSAVVHNLVWAQDRKWVVMTSLD